MDGQWFAEWVESGPDDLHSIGCASRAEAKRVAIKNAKANGWDNCGAWIKRRTYSKRFGWETVDREIWLGDGWESVA